MTAPGRPPSNDQELIRSLHDRIRALELSKTTRVGSWVIGDKDGTLTATAPGQGSINLSARAAAMLTGNESSQELAQIIGELPNIGGILNPEEIVAMINALISELIKNLLKGLTTGSLPGFNIDLNLIDLIKAFLSFGSNNNPAVAQLSARIAALESASTGDTGVHDKFARTSLNPVSSNPADNWLVLTPTAPVIVESSFVWSNGDVGVIQHPVNFTTKRVSVSATVVLDRPNMNGESGIWIGSPSDHVWLQFDRSQSGGDRLRIRSVVNGNARSSGVSRESYNPPNNLVSGDVIMLQYSPQDSTWIAFLNARPVAQWPDDTGIIPIDVGASHGLMVNMTGGSSNKGAGLTSYAGFDY